MVNRVSIFHTKSCNRLTHIKEKGILETMEFAPCMETPPVVLPTFNLIVDPNPDHNELELVLEGTVEIVVKRRAKQYHLEILSVEDHIFPGSPRKSIILQGNLLNLTTLKHDLEKDRGWFCLITESRCS